MADQFIQIRIDPSSGRSCNLQIIYYSVDYFIIFDEVRHHEVYQTLKAIHL